MTQFALSDVTVEFGATTLLKGVTWTVGAGDRWGVVGRNGSGKTTLFKLVTGALAPTRGQVTRVGGTKISLLEQHRDFGQASTVWEAAAGAFADLLQLERSLAVQSEALSHHASPEALERYGHDLERFEREGGYTMASRVDAVLHGLGFDPEKSREQLIATLSGGERGRLGVARQLVAPADVLLLDEPTNHLDLETTRWLEEFLQGTSQTVVVISHDRAFLANVADHVLHVDQATATPYTGGYASFVAQHAERLLTLERAVAKQQKAIAGEEDYIRRNIAGQNSKQAKGRRKRLERLPRLSPPLSDDDAMALRLEIRERGGDQVLLAEHVEIGVDDRVLISDFNTRVMRGDRIGILGENGGGKSTLLKAIVGERSVDEGELRLGLSTHVAYYRQDLAQVPLGKTLYETINELRPLWTRGQIQSHLARFGFSGDEVQRRAESLSGGERARVALAIMMLSGANLLILDEPTNHLDVESIEALEDAIERYPGTVLVVSHDRALLRNLATRIWALYRKRITVFDGTFGEWEVVSEERAQAAATAEAEENARRRARERKEAERRETSAPAANGERALRAARRAVEAAELDVTRAEMEVERLTEELSDAALYSGADMAARSAALAAQLASARDTLNSSMERWSAASTELERLNEAAR